MSCLAGFVRRSECLLPRCPQLFGFYGTEASQASDVGSIPIARSINPDDSVDLTRLSSLNSIKTRPVLDGGWTVLDSIGRSVFTGVFAVGANRQRAFGWWNGTNTGLLG